MFLLSTAIIFCVLVLSFYFLFFKKIRMTDIVKTLPGNNIKRIIKKIDKLQNINETAIFMTNYVSKKDHSKTEIQNETLESKSSFIRIEKATLLMVSIIYNNDINIIKYILEKGADVNIQDENGNTAFLYAALYYQNPDILDLLIKYGADKNAKNVLGANAAIIAVYNNNIDILNKIINMGIDINCQNKNGWTALMSAVLDFRPIEIIQLLINNGADINIQNKTGKTVIEIAKEFNNNAFLKNNNKNF